MAKKTKKKIALIGAGNIGGTLAMLACLAAGRPFVALDTDHPKEWLDHALEDARPILIITGEKGLADVEPRVTPMRVIPLRTVPKAAQEGWRPARLGGLPRGRSRRRRSTRA